MKKAFLKNLGAILMILGALALICSFFFGWNNTNWVQGTAMVTIVIGLIVYIVLNKKFSN